LRKGSPAVESDEGTQNQQQPPPAEKKAKTQQQQPKPRAKKSGAAVKEDKRADQQPQQSVKTRGAAVKEDDGAEEDVSVPIKRSPRNLKKAEAEVEVEDEEEVDMDALNDSEEEEAVVESEDDDDDEEEEPLPKKRGRGGGAKKVPAKRARVAEVKEEKPMVLIDPSVFDALLPAAMEGKEQLKALWVILEGCPKLKMIRAGANPDTKSGAPFMRGCPPKFLNVWKASSSQLVQSLVECEGLNTQPVRDAIESISENHGASSVPLLTMLQSLLVKFVDKTLLEEDVDIPTLVDTLQGTEHAVEAMTFELVGGGVLLRRGFSEEDLQLAMNMPVKTIPKKVAVSACRVAVMTLLYNLQVGVVSALGSRL
jgi:hypothetical protein